MDDPTLYKRQLDTLAAIDRMMALAGPDSTNLELPGVSVLIVPATPDRSVMNAVCYTDSSALAAGYDEISRAYDEAGITAWTVWTPAADTATARLLEERGHALDADPMVMCARMEELRLDPARLDGVEWTADASLAELAEVAGPAFGFEGDGLARAVSGPTPGAYNYIAKLEGEPVASVMAYDHEGDCGIYWVATSEHARGRGLSTAMMTAALIDGRDRGCTSTSLQATNAGYPVYSRLGYRDFGPIQMWERRATP
jgi:GNAT superfamily N-acetyltransferase